MQEFGPPGPVSARIAQQTYILKRLSIISVKHGAFSKLKEGRCTFKILRGKPPHKSRAQSVWVLTMIPGTGTGRTQPREGNLVVNWSIISGSD